jgi:hypothetical protein
VEQDLEELTAALTFDSPELLQEVEAQLADLAADAPPIRRVTERELATRKAILDLSRVGARPEVIAALMNEVAHLEGEQQRKPTSDAARFRATVGDLKNWARIFPDASPQAKKEFFGSALERVAVRPVTRMSRGGTYRRERPPVEVVSITPRDPLVGLALATGWAAKWGLERETGFEPATSTLGRWHSAN